MIGEIIHFSAQPLGQSERIARSARASAAVVASLPMDSRCISQNP